jgi:plasmid stabilization system protein ParE
MESVIVWTERASGDIEAIVRYITRRDPQAAGRIGLGIYPRTALLPKEPQRPGAGFVK